jgi:hypothetical protein
MVKNTKGGSGHKGQARKYNKPIGNQKLRLAEDPCEMYACIEKRLGGEYCQVKCTDGKTRLCVIRGKFRGGSGKKDNFVTRDSWVLVGLREWETNDASNSNKLPKCDLLEVYKETDKMKLKTITGIHWSHLVSESQTNDAQHNADDIVFSDNTNEEEYKKWMENLASHPQSTTLLSLEEEPEKEEIEIDIDDI